VTDIILIFKSLMASFFAYEEYCANHEIIAHDLQKNLPTLWSTYEAGMESLARSIVSLDHREPNSRRGLTVGDLLVKPIQRVCRYPLLFEDLLRHTPVADCPSAHADVELVLRQFKDLVQTVNTATDSPGARFHIYRRWSLLSRLNLDQSILHQDDFRMLGNTILCGVLYLTYQTRSNVDGAYALCVLFRSSFLIALPNGGNGSFDLTAFIMLSDLKLESASDGKGSLTPRYLTHANGCIGLQAPSALHTWKLCFTVEGNLHEFLLSACSAVEEEQWRRGLRGELGSDPCPGSSSFDLPTGLVLELKAVGVVYDRHGTLARRLSVQRAATVGNRASICQVILRNTYNAEELHEFRQLSTSAIKRSHSHLTTNRPVVLSPKRSERARLEAMLSDIWTKDKLPYPGMIASRGGQIIRASAGSLVRKLSLASIHGPFSRRSASLTIPSRKSYEAFSDSRRSRERLPTFEVCRDSFEHKPALKNKLATAHDLPELDTMDSVINRMIGDHNKMPSPAGGDGIRRRGTLKKQPVKATALPVGPNDSAQTFYPEEVEKAQKEAAIEDVLTGKKKRWSNPMALLKRPLKEGIRGLVYSSR
jgi:RhoGEF domain